MTNNEIDDLALPILKQVLTEAQGQWSDINSKYREYRNLQIDKRGSFGERFFEQALSRIYFRRLKIEYNDGDQGDWDLKFNGIKFEIKTSSLDVNNKFQNESLKNDGNYDGVLFLGIAPNDLYIRFLRKYYIDFEKLEVKIDNKIIKLHDRGKNKKDEKSTGAGFKCDFKLQDMIKIECLNDLKNEFEKHFKECLGKK